MTTVWSRGVGTTPPVVGTPPAAVAMGAGVPEGALAAAGAAGALSCAGRPGAQAASAAPTARVVPPNAVWRRLRRGRLRLPLSSATGDSPLDWSRGLDAVLTD